MAIIALSFTFIFVKSIDFTWTTLVLGLTVSLLSSFLFFVVFRRFDDDKKNEKKSQLMREIGIYSKIEDQYWIGLISELSVTKDDIIFYGHTMGAWLKPQFKNHLIGQLKNKRKETKVYFILYNQTYCEKWKILFTQESIDVLVIQTKDRPIYSLACCGTKTSIVLLADPNDMDDRITFEISSKSDIGQVYIGYLTSLRDAHC